ncbi:MAG TPA: DUF192 domain-containing protein [Candidatus Binatia bacterium]
MRPNLVCVVVLGFTMLQGLTACRADPNVAISTRQGREVVFQVEIADSPAKRELGLQYRRDLAPDRGMIFLFPAETEQTFWMKNTPIPLDMIFIDHERKIVGIVEQTVPFSLDARSVGKPSQFVLEINGGLTKRYGIQAGDRVRFEAIPMAGGE